MARVGQLRPVEIITVGKRRFAAGLLWKPIKSSRNYLAEVRASGKAEGKSAYVAVHGRVQLQAGYAHGKGIYGAYAMAPALMSTLGADWIAVFALDATRYALIAVQGGAVLPGYDLVGNFDAIGTSLRQVSALIADEPAFVEHGTIIAPDVFGVTNDARDLAQLLAATRVTPAMQLRPLSFGVTPKQALVALAIVLLVAGGVYGSMQWRARAQRIAALRAAAAAQQAQAAAAGSATVPLPPPWITQPGAADVIAMCRAAADGVPLSVAGWRVSRADCNGGSVTVSYERGATGATLLAFLADASAAVEWVTTVDPAGERASRLRTLTPAQAKTDDVLSTSDALRDRLTDFAQRVAGYAHLTATLQAPPPPPADDPKRPPPPWTAFDMRLESSVSPGVLLDGLHLDGLRITGVSATSAEGAGLKWTLTGVWYANR